MHYLLRGQVVIAESRTLKESPKEFQTHDEDVTKRRLLVRTASPGGHGTASAAREVPRLPREHMLESTLYNARKS